MRHEEPLPSTCARQFAAFCGLLGAVTIAAGLNTRPAFAGNGLGETHCQTLPFVIGALEDSCVLDQTPFENYGDNVHL